MRYGFEKSRREIWRENRLIKEMIIESEKPKPRTTRNPVRFGSAGFMMPRRRRWLCLSGLHIWTAR